MSGRSQRIWSAPGLPTRDPDRRLQLADHVVGIPGPGLSFGLTHPCLEPFTGERGPPFRPCAVPESVRTLDPISRTLIMSNNPGPDRRAPGGTDGDRELPEHAGIRPGRRRTVPGPAGPARRRPGPG